MTAGRTLNQNWEAFFKWITWFIHSQRAILWDTFSVICTYYGLGWKNVKESSREQLFSSTGLLIFLVLPPIIMSRNSTHQSWGPSATFTVPVKIWTAQALLSRGTDLALILQMMGHNRSRNCHRRRYWLNLHFSLVPSSQVLEREYVWTPGIARNLLSENHLRWISILLIMKHKRNSGLWFKLDPKMLTLRIDCMR